MASQTEVPAPGEFIVSEANGSRSRENVVIASGSGIIPAGRIVGKITAGGKYDNYSGATNVPVGTGTVAGILYAQVDASTSDQPAVIIARDAEVVNSRVTAEVGGDKTTGLTGLVTLGIFAR